MTLLEYKYFEVPVFVKKNDKVYAFKYKGYSVGDSPHFAGLLKQAKSGDGEIFSKIEWTLSQLAILNSFGRLLIFALIVPFLILSVFSLDIVLAVFLIGTAAITYVVSGLIDNSVTKYFIQTIPYRKGYTYTSFTPSQPVFEEDQQALNLLENS